MRSTSFGPVAAGILVAMMQVSAGSAQAGDLLDSESFDARHSGQPAVSEINGKIDFGYLHYDSTLAAPNFMDDGHGYVLQGAVSIPVGHSFGLQIDAGAMSGDFDAAAGSYSVDGRAIGAHLFWRDPSVGLIGGYAHYADYDFGNPINDEIVNVRFGAEAELYLGQFTLRGFAGRDKLDIGAFGDDHFFSGQAEALFYATENLAFSLGVDHSFETTSLTVGFEAMADFGGISPAVYADASFSGDDRAVMAGLRFYFGSASKSLMARHREDDPELGLFDNFAQLGSCINGLNPGGGGLQLPPEFALDVQEPFPGFNQQLDGCGLTGGGGGGPIIRLPGDD